MTQLAASEIFRASVGSCLIFLSLCVLWVGIKILRGRRNEYERNRSRASSAWAVFTGALNPRRDGRRDDKVAAGLAISTTTNEWVEQGRYSDEALHDVVTR
jgi:hypothetical protein